MQINIKRLHKDAQLPKYAHNSDEDAGMDIRTTEGQTIIQPGEGHLFVTGLAMAIPSGCEVQIRSRSSLACKHDLIIPNSPATIDPGFRGELKVKLFNIGKTPYTVEAGERIAQIVVSRYEPVEWLEGELPESVRGEGGFGSSGRH